MSDDDHSQAISAHGVASSPPGCCTPGCWEPLETPPNDLESYPAPGGESPAEAASRDILPYTGFYPRWMRSRTDADAVLDETPAVGSADSPDDPKTDALGGLVAGLTPEQRTRLASLLDEAHEADISARR
jgi:hypothetical protein